ncbi:MAG: AAA family ATPase [Bacilli bacterium]|nr:AAA family ATPase [Bacilli bacterium]
MAFDDLKLNQPEIVKIIDNSYNRRKLVHAYIFEGEAGTGKMEAAKYIASKLLCREETKPCCICNSCQRVLNGTHINVNIVEADGEVIKKEQITNLLKESSMKTLEKGSRIHIIKDADKLNQASANALLKFIEEPYPNHYVILTTKNSGKMLSTIISRCQLIHFKPIKKELLENKLIENGVERDTAFVLSHLTSNVDKANELISEGIVITIIETIKKLMLTEISGNDKYITYLISNTNLPKKDIYFNRLFLEIYGLFLEEKIHYLENPTLENHFVEVFSRLNLDKENVKDVIKQLDVICDYEKRLNTYPNAELMYASLFIEL